jgi:hypothetical protein
MKNVRQDRLNSYAKMSGPCGASRDQRDLEYWSKRASANSEIAPRSGSRASNGAVTKDLDPPRLHSTGKEVSIRDTASKPYRSTKVDAHMVAKNDPNFSGSSGYMRGVRRDAT